MIEESESGSVSLNNGSGSGRHKNIWILRIRILIRNTASKQGETHFTIEAVAEGEPVVDLGEQVAHVPRVLRLHFTFEPVHLVHVFAEKRK